MLTHIKDVIIKAILAGIAIGVGGTLYLSVDNKYIGSLLFGIGLFCIFSFGFNLYTGKIGFLITEKNKRKFAVDLILIWLGNIIGTGITALCLRLTRISDELSQKASELCKVKLSDNLLSIFILAIFCGLLMYIAAHNYGYGKNSAQKYIATFICVMVFILCSFEHCVANMFYFWISFSFTAKTLLYLLVMTIGNSVGAFIIPLALKFCKENNGSRN